MGNLARWIEHRMRLLGMGTQQELAERSGVSLRSISRILTRNTLAGTERSTRLWLARTLAVGWADLHLLDSGGLEWIADDRIVRDDVVFSAFVAPGMAVQVPGVPDGEWGVPVLGRVAAGGLVESVVEGCEVRRLPLVFPGACGVYALRVAGDSMAPAYLPDEYIVVQNVEAGSVKDGEDLVVQLDGGGDGKSTFKRAYRVSSGLKLVAINPKYAPIEVPWERVVRVGRVIGKYVPVAMDFGGYLAAVDEG